MITQVRYKLNDGHLYAIITRDSITPGESIAIAIAGKSYRKYLPAVGTEVTIDITPYAKAALSGSIKDLYDIQPGIEVDMETLHMVARPTVEGYAELPGLYSENVSRKEGLLTRLPHLRVCLGSRGTCKLPIVVYTYDDGNIKVACGGEEVQFIGRDLVDHLHVAFVETTQPDEVRIEDYTNGISRTLPIRVAPRGMNTRVLWWRNEEGGIDTWPFEFVRESALMASSEVFYTADKGYTRTQRQHERQHILETRELDDITADVVAYIIASPEVYLEDEQGLTPIDIITEECRTYSDAELTTIQIAYRNRKRDTL